MATATHAPAGHRLGLHTLRDEVALESLPVEGEVPAWLRGALVRTGPALFEAGARTVRHLFDGQAMLHRFGFRDGRVDYRNRFLRTRQLEAIEERGELGLSEFATDPCRRLFGRVMASFSPRFTDNGNVNVIALEGEALAVTETPMPVAFDPETLATLGTPAWAKEIPGMHVSAHPHHDPARGELVSWAVRIGPRSAYRVWAMTAGAGERRPRTVASIPARLPCYMHSFGLTDRFAVLVEQPLVLDPRRMLLSGRPFIDNYEWRPERGCAFLLVDRHAGRLVARVQAPPFFVFHVVNAWEEGEEVVVDLCAYDDAEIVGSLLLDALRGDGARVPGAELRRWRVPVRDGATAIGGRPLAQPNLELPRIDYARRNSRPYRVTWGVSAGGSGPGDRARAHLGDRLVRIDVEDGTVLAWGEDGCFPGEPVPVREPGADAEDAGVVLSVVLDARAGTSFLLVLDAATMAERARATVPHHIPYGFHGAFV